MSDDNQADAGKKVLEPTASSGQSVFARSGSPPQQPMLKPNCAGPNDADRVGNIGLLSGICGSLQFGRHAMQHLRDITRSASLGELNQLVR